MKKPSFNRERKIILFWVAVAFVIIFAIGLAVLDTKNNPIICRGASTTKCNGAALEKSAFLIANELDAGAKQIKVSLLVPEFDPNRGTLTVKSASPGLKPDETNYETHLLPAQVRPGVWVAITLPYNSESFFYPFENYVLDFRLDLQERCMNPETNKEEPVEVPVKLEVRNHIGEFIAESCRSYYSFEESEFDTNGFSLTFKRHRFVRATAIILYFVAFAFLGYILRREETSKALSNSLGYIAALWGIRQIISGSVKLFPTIVDFVTLGLYVIVVAIVAYKWIFGSKESSSGQGNTDETR